MLRRLVTGVSKTQLQRAYHFNTVRYGELGAQPGLVAKRLIDCIGKCLREIDPERWEGIPITFKTNWRDEGGSTDIRTCIMVHDAIEREFGIDILDRNIILSDIGASYYVVLQSHDAH